MNDIMLVIKYLPKKIYRTSQVIDFLSWILLAGIFAGIFAKILALLLISLAILVIIQVINYCLKNYYPKMEIGLKIKADGENLKFICHDNSTQYTVAPKNVLKKSDKIERVQINLELDGLTRELHINKEISSDGNLQLWVAKKRKLDWGDIYQNNDCSNIDSMLDSSSEKNHKNSNSVRNSQTNITKQEETSIMQRSWLSCTAQAVVISGTTNHLNYKFTTSICQKNPQLALILEAAMQNIMQAQKKEEARAIYTIFKNLFIGNIPYGKQGFWYKHSMEITESLQQSTQDTNKSRRLNFTPTKQSQDQSATVVNEETIMQKSDQTIHQKKLKDFMILLNQFIEMASSAKLIILIEDSIMQVGDSLRLKADFKYIDLNNRSFDCTDHEILLGRLRSQTLQNEKIQIGSDSSAQAIPLFPTEEEYDDIDSCIRIWQSLQLIKIYEDKRGNWHNWKKQVGEAFLNERANVNTNGKQSQSDQLKSYTYTDQEPEIQHIEGGEPTRLEISQQATSNANMNNDVTEIPIHDNSPMLAIQEKDKKQSVEYKPDEFYTFLETQIENTIIDYRLGIRKTIFTKQDTKQTKALL